MSKSSNVESESDRIRSNLVDSSRTSETFQCFHCYLLFELGSTCTRWRTVSNDARVVETSEKASLNPKCRVWEIRLPITPPSWLPSLTLAYFDRLSSCDKLCVDSKRASVVPKFRKILNAARTSGRKFSIFQLAFEKKCSIARSLSHFCRSRLKN